MKKFILLAVAALVVTFVSPANAAVTGKHHQGCKSAAHAAGKHFKGHQAKGQHAARHHHKHA